MNTKFEKFSSWLDINIVPKATNFAQNRFVTSVTGGLLAYMPFTIIASVFMMISWMPIPGWENFVNNLFGVSDPSIWRAQMSIVSNSTLDIGGIFVLLGITKNLSEKYELNSLQCQLTGLASLMILTTLFKTDAGTSIPVAKVGAQAMFLVILVSILSVEIYRFTDSRNIKISMPEGVPPNVAKPFEALLPTFFVIVIMFFTRQFFDLVLHKEVLAVITMVISIPLLKLGGTLGGTIIAVSVTQFLWFFGIHGGDVVGSVMNPLWLMLEDQNRVLSLAGNLPTNIISHSFLYHYVYMGTTAGIVVALFMVGRSKRYRDLAKLSAGPMLFNIGEPVLFGLPIVLNIIYVIPYILTPIVSALIGYAAFASGIVPIPTGLAQLAWTTPPVISGYLVTGSILGGVLQLVIILAVALLWVPFVRFADRENLSQEKIEIE